MTTVNLNRLFTRTDGVGISESRKSTEKSLHINDITIVPQLEDPIITGERIKSNRFGIR